MMIINPEQAMDVALGFMIIILAKVLISETSSSFWKGALPPYRERYDAQSEVSSQSFHSSESNGELLYQQESSTQMAISESLNQLNLT